MGMHIVAGLVFAVVIAVVAWIWWFERKSQ